MLKEADRQKLDTIVQKMTANGESDANIQFVVNDFKNKYDTGTVEQSTATPAKQEGSWIGRTSRGVVDFFTKNAQQFGESIGKAAYLATGGQKQATAINQQNADTGTQLFQLAKKTRDPLRKQKLLEQAAQAFKASGMATEDIVGEIKSNKQYLGEAGSVLLDILTAGTYGKAATTAMKSFKLGKTTAPTVAAQLAKGVGFKQGAIQGAKTGAAVGTAYGVTEGMKEDKGVGGVIISGVQGGITGGFVGGAVGGISGKIQAKTLGAEEQERSLRNLVPQPKELSTKQYEELLRQGKITPKSFLGTAKVIPDKDEIRMATQYSDLLKSNDPVKNTNGVIDELAANNKKVEAYFDKQLEKGVDLTFDQNALKGQIKDRLAPITDIYVPSEKRLNALKNQIVNSLFDELPENPTLKDLWLARQKFDRVIDTKVNAFGGKDTIKKEISREARNAVQEFIINDTGDGFYKEKMATMTDLFRILEKLDIKNNAEKGKSGLEVWMRKNPAKAKALGSVGAVSGGYLVYNTLKKLGLF